MRRGIPRLRITGSLLLCLLAAACSSQAPPTAPPASPTPAVQLEEPLRGALSRWNYYRESAGVPPITTDAALSEAARMHSKYLVKNHIQGPNAFVERGAIRDVLANPGVRAESAGNPWYTEAGEKAAERAYIIRTDTLAQSGAPIVDKMISRGLNVLPMLDPQAAAIGYGQYCENRDCVVTISWKLGLTRDQFLSIYDASRFAWNPRLGEMPFTIARLRRPIFFPSAGTQAAASFDGAAKPDLLTSCGYHEPSGIPIALELGAAVSGHDEVKVSSYSVSDNGVEIESCAFDAATYKNPDGYQQRMARWYLHSFGAAMIIPRDPLKPGHTYTVAVTADNQPYTWSFSVAPDAK